MEYFMEKVLPVLYILMRNDMASMNPGKAMAQASHASNSFQHHMNVVLKDENDGLAAEKFFNDWANTTNQGFGTVLTLAVDEDTMRERVAMASEMGFYAKVVHDPTYPLVDGQTVHFIPVDTCAWIYAPNKYDEKVGWILGDLNLHP